MEQVYNDFIKTYNLLKERLSWEYIDVLNFNVQFLDEFFKGIILDVQGKPKSPFVEDKLNPPSMVCYFYYFLFLYKRVPNQLEYIDFYYERNKGWVNEMVGKELDQAFKGRLSRFYPSMLRDFHFYHLLKESHKFDRVLYVLKHDLDSKIDIFVKSRGKWYGVQLRTRTYRSDTYYKKKYNRNMVWMKANLIDIPISLFSARSIVTKGNDLKLYSKVHIDQIINEISKFENTGSDFCER